ncbi:hypothetical protein M5D96_006217 [Drosophila gunungcola]|uniref:Uncharacterized protein n=2 Tax=Drosophila gunungcola TaxID=103775 RepID=A0A9Q0BPT4_9MUSC|nr:hypothetical protein M5D96_006217 [Drosophila gunungcola]
MDIPPLPQANDEVAPGSGSESEASTETIFIEDDEDDESDQPNSSSGFVESNESASSGIDTSVYDTSSTGSSLEEYEYESDEENYSVNNSSEEEYDHEGEDYDLESIGEEQDDEAVSNVSLAGTSSEGSAGESSSSESDKSDDGSDTLTDGNPLHNVTHDAQSQWVQTFNAQYQFIASYVASHIKNYN